MVIKCLECNYKCGNIACLKYHYESCHKDKIDKSICGNITISAICANDFSPWGCSLKNESSSSSGSASNSSSSSSSNSSSDSGSSSSSGSGSDSSYNTSSNSDPNPNYNSVPNLNPNPNYNSVLNLNPNPNPNPNTNPKPNYNSEVLISERDEVLCTPTAPQIHEVVSPIRNCNTCNYIKPLTDFDESKYTCRSCTSTKVNCPYCTSVVRYDGIRAHVKKQHPGVELTKGFSRNLTEKQSSKTESTLAIRQNEEDCSCKYFDFVLFLINNGINIVKVKENINLLKSIDNLK